MFGQAAEISHNVASLCQLGPGALHQGGWGGPGELGLPPTATRLGHLLVLAAQKPERFQLCSMCCLGIGQAGSCGDTELENSEG